MDWGEYDSVVAGAGIAGALTTYFLHQSGSRVLWLDPNEMLTSTKAGAGIMNPVTGRNYLWSWKYAEFESIARKTYREIERMTGMSLLHDLPILRNLPTIQDQESWAMRKAEPIYNEVLQEPIPGTDYVFLLHAPWVGSIYPASRVDMMAVVSAVGKMAGSWKQGLVLPGRRVLIESQNLEIPDHLPLFLCTGASAFPGIAEKLPMAWYKGEALIIESNDLPEDVIIQHKAKIVPVGNHQFWVGSVDSWDWKEEGPTTNGRKVLSSKLDTYFNISYEIVEVKAGIRPASRRRRPFIGRVPGSVNTWLMNGLGTKGASLAPLTASKLVDAAVNGKELDSEWTWALDFLS